MNSIKRIKTGFLVVLIGIISMGVFAQDQIPDDFCISTNELKLYNLINQYRQEHKLAEVPLSKNLCYVAKLHVSDLQYNRPDTAGCNLHSWSDQGHWAECCYGRNIFNNSCMTAKPKELTDYPGDAYEIAFWESVDAIPEVVLNLWKSSEASADLILNRDIWTKKSWKSFGVGMLDGYAVVWFGAEADAEEGVKVCNTGKMAGRLIDRQSGSDKASAGNATKYYLIISSFTDESSAKAEVSKYKARGFRNPSVIQSGANFRVALGNYPSHEKAIQARNSLNDSYKNAWVLKH